ncbi:MAG: hypothetical protein IPK28_10625 [Devosia sp.]|nr:hypothetical protein [Devosia sp.]
MSGKRDPERSIRRLSLAGGLAALLLVGGAGGLSAAIEFAGAVIAAGVVVAKTDVMSIQHARGGIIAGIDISEGERVGTGQRLIRLDGTQLAASLAIIISSRRNAGATGATERGTRRRGPVRTACSAR